MGRARSTARPAFPRAWLVCVVAWAVPGAGHLWVGRQRTGLIVCAVLLLMFSVGLWLDGRLYGFDGRAPFGVLLTLADLGIGMPYFAARVLELGDGRVVAATYEHGSTFLVVAGLLNVLVALDAYDIADGRKQQTP